MDRIRIVGGQRLNGAIPISGAKNATLPLMIASLLTEGTLILEGDRLIATDLKSAAGPGAAAAKEPPPENAASATVSDSVPHQRVFEDFIQAIRSGSTPACDARQARPSVAIIQAIYRSAKSGKFEKP